MILLMIVRCIIVRNGEYYDSSIICVGCGDAVIWLFIVVFIIDIIIIVSISMIIMIMMIITICIITIISITIIITLINMSCDLCEFVSSLRFVCTCLHRLRGRLRCLIYVCFRC